MQRQLEALGAQRAGLEDMLKDMKRKVCISINFNYVYICPFSPIFGGMNKCNWDGCMNRLS